MVIEVVLHVVDFPVVSLMRQFLGQVDVSVYVLIICPDLHSTVGLYWILSVELGEGCSWSTIIAGSNPFPRHACCEVSRSPWWDFYF
jgi:hypothetical protein